MSEHRAVCSVHNCHPKDCMERDHYNLPADAHMKWALLHLQEVLDMAAQLGIRISARYTETGHVAPVPNVQ